MTKAGGINKLQKLDKPASKDKDLEASPVHLLFIVLLWILYSFVVGARARH